LHLWFGEWATSFKQNPCQVRGKRLARSMASCHDMPIATFLQRFYEWPKATRAARRPLSTARYRVRRRADGGMPGTALVQAALSRRPRSQVEATFSGLRGHLRALQGLSEPVARSCQIRTQRLQLGT